MFLPLNLQVHKTILLTLFWGCTFGNGVSKCCFEQTCCLHPQGQTRTVYQTLTFVVTTHGPIQKQWTLVSQRIEHAYLIKLRLPYVPVHTKMAYRGRGGRMPLIPILGISWGKILLIPNEDLVGHSAGLVWEKRKKSAVPAKNQAPAHPVHSLVPTRINSLVQKLNAWLDCRAQNLKDSCLTKVITGRNVNRILDIVKRLSVWWIYRTSGTKRLSCMAHKQTLIKYYRLKFQTGLFPTYCTVYTIRKLLHVSANTQRSCLVEGI